MKIYLIVKDVYNITDGLFISRDITFACSTLEKARRKIKKYAESEEDFLLGGKIVLRNDDCYVIETDFYKKEPVFQYCYQIISRDIDPEPE